MRLVHSVAPLNCSNESNWFTARNGKLILKQEAVPQNASIQCELQPFVFNDDFTVKTLDRSEAKDNMSLQTDFFKIQCAAADGKNYTNYHATIVPKESMNERANPVIGFNRPLNIYFLGFDSVSRMSFMRKLKETYKHITEVLNGTVLEMYNTVGDGTSAALLPILTGKTEVELPETRKSQPNASFVDVYPFIWKELKRFGYATLSAEDVPSIGTYTYRWKGFKEQPTDHYLRNFYLKVDEDTRKYNPSCLGSESVYQVHLSYVEDFFTTYPREQPKFAFQIHVGYSHDDLDRVELADGPTVEHLKFFQEKGFLNDTVLIVFSDHGSRYSALRRTKQGKLEERNPFVSIILPPWFKEAFPTAVRNVVKNGNRLTTPFDLHATVKSLLNFPPPKVGNLSNRGISLFSEIPASRDCANAGIPLHWCSCLSWKKFSTDALISWYIADELVKAFNEQLKKEQMLCSPLRLDSVLEAYVSQPEDDFVAFVESKGYDGREPRFGRRIGVPYDSYRLTIRTNPRKAIYEATVLYDVTKAVLLIDLDLVSRVNAYGTAPHCIMSKDSYLAIWCVCYDQL
ncbi:DUF229 domain containing protein [Trichuris trichiura]|uniref:DUF229 domain containing protein n=1 Tax=Trichuris trichiura TaxID=36087 RepID=A0A077ZKF6_TRITR|nr:DUF229 domain containing protein [Trichuris trichiura]